MEKREKDEYEWVSDSFFGRNNNGGIPTMCNSQQQAWKIWAVGKDQQKDERASDFFPIHKKYRRHIAKDDFWLIHMDKELVEEKKKGG